MSEMEIKLFFKFQVIVEMGDEELELRLYSNYSLYCQILLDIYKKIHF